METVTIRVPIGKVISSTDRKYGGEGNLETLAKSMETHGLIHPPAVKETPDNKGHYRVIAGRRRHAAAKLLGWKNIEVTVYPEKADDEAIALAENVNREDMHPLDEAETFKRQIEAGKSVEEVAKHYARSTSGIHQRIRLTNLIDGIKTMFRDGKINLSGAALIASLPEEDQEKFFKKHGEKNVDNWEVKNFLGSVRRSPLQHILDKECGKCKKRTHNTTPGLFDDFHSLEDVCFDGDCYAKKWQSLIAGLIAEQSGETGKNIIFGNGIPQFYSKKATSVTIGGEEHTLLSANKYAWKVTNKKGKANTAWLVSLVWSSGSYKLKASRVSYEELKRQSYNSYSTPLDPVKTFMVDQLPNLTQEEQKAVAEKVEKKFQSSWQFKNGIKEALLDTIIEKMLQEKSKENLAAMYISEKRGGEDDEGNWHEFDPDYQSLFDKIFGSSGITKLSDIQSNPMLEKVFMFLIATGLRTNDLPDLDDDDEEWAQTEQSLFWKFAQIDKELYLQLYREILDEAVSSAIRDQKTGEK